MSTKNEKESAFKFTIDGQKLEAARAAFFSPQNNQIELEKMFDELWNLSNGGTKNFIDSKNPKVKRALKKILAKVNHARRFDEKYLGHMLSESAAPALLAYIMALRIGSNTVAREVSVLESELEPEVISWVNNLIGFGKEASGTFTSGGSLANTTALWVARELAAEQVGDDYEGRYVVLVNPFVHYSIDKSLRILGGPGGKSISTIKIPSKDLAIDPKKLDELVSQINRQNNTVSEKITILERKKTLTQTEQKELKQLRKKLIKIMAVVSIAGETETGVVDPLDEISKIAGKYGLYHHVDAAYGLSYLLSSKRDLFNGISTANSVTFDPHKTLYTPYSAGMVLFKDPKEHGKVNFNSKDAAYVFKPGEISLGQKRIEGSMGAGSILASLAVVQSLSSEEFKALFDHTLNNIEYLFERLSKSKILEPIHKPDLNVLCFTIRPDVCKKMGITTNAQLLELIESSRKRLNDDFGFFFSATNLPVDQSVKTLERDSDSQPVFRAVLMHPRTERDHINQSIDLLEKIITNKI